MPADKSQRPGAEERSQTRGKAAVADTRPAGKKNGVDTDDVDEESKGSGAVVFFAGLIILLVWLAIIAILIHMDVGGIGTMLEPYLSKVPVVKRVLPESTRTKTAEKDDPYAFSSMQDAVARVKQLEKQVASQKKQLQQAENSSADLAQAKKQLKKYQNNEKKFEQEKQEFYEQVVYADNAPDTSEYQKYYEEIEPDNAEKIYKQVVADSQTDSQLTDYAKTYSAMKPQEAADIFDSMTNNLKLVAKILNAMSADSRGQILGKMDAKTAAAVTKLLEPSATSSSD